MDNCPSWICLKFKPPAHTSSWPLLSPRSWADRMVSRTARSYPQLRVFMVTFINSHSSVSGLLPATTSRLSQVYQEENDLLFSPATPSSINKYQLFAFRQSSAPCGERASSPIPSLHKVPCSGVLFSFVIFAAKTEVLSSKWRQSNKCDSLSIYWNNSFYSSPVKACFCYL